MFQPTCGTFTSPRNSEQRPGSSPRPATLRRLFAAVEEELQAEADAEKGQVRASTAMKSRRAVGVDRGRRAEVADTGNDDPRRLPSRSTGSRRDERKRADRRQTFQNGREVAGVVVDDCDPAPAARLAHNSPFVEGSIRPSCLSFEQATRSARANALKIASTW